MGREKGFHSSTAYIPSVISAEVVEQVGERVAELDHALRRQRHLRARAAAGDGLRHAQEAPARVLLQVQVVAAVVLRQCAMSHLCVLYPKHEN